MKFSTAALPILALFTQQAVAVALPFSDELAARHHMPNDRSPQFGNGNNFGGNRFGNGNGFGGGNKGGNGGGNKGSGSSSVAASKSVAAGTSVAASTSVAATSVASSVVSSAVTSTTSAIGNSNVNTGGNRGGKNGGGNKGTGKGGNGTTGTTTTAAGGGTGTASSSSVAASSTSTVAGTGSTAATGTGSTNGTNSGLSQAQITALQSSLTLDLSQVMPGLLSDGQETPEAGQVPSLTSSNNYINFCATQQGTPLTNGQQIKTGSCNPVPMGRIIQTDKLPSAKFLNPKNMDTLGKNQTFTIEMNILNLVTGNFVNAQANYYAAPCQVDGTGTGIGHSHFVIEEMTSLTDTTPKDPLKFSFFIGVNGAAKNGVLSATVTNGLLDGVYRMCSINTCSNHQPVFGSVAQHGSFDDCIYFTVQ